MYYRMCGVDTSASGNTADNHTPFWRRKKKTKEGATLFMAIVCILFLSRAFQIIPCVLTTLLHFMQFGSALKPSKFRYPHLTLISASFFLFSNIRFTLLISSPTQRNCPEICEPIIKQKIKGLLPSSHGEH